jgi:hypothetical protein
MTPLHFIEKALLFIIVVFLGLKLTLTLSLNVVSSAAGNY